MKSLIKFFIGPITILVFFFFLLLTTLRFQLTNPEFLISALGKSGVYEQSQRALRLGLKNKIESQFEKRGGNLEKLTVGERAIFAKQIDEITNVITAEKIQDFSETNIRRILSYVNGQADKLILYLPLEKWGLYEGLEEDVIPIFSEETDVLSLIDSSESESSISKEQLANLYNFKGEIQSNWSITTIVLGALIILHLLLGKGKSRLYSTGKLIATTAGLVLALSLLLTWTNDRLTKSLPVMETSSQILIGAVVPAVVSEIIKLWFGIGAGMLALGLLLIFVNSLINKREEKMKRAKAQTNKFPIKTPLLVSLNKGRMDEA